MESMNTYVRVWKADKCKIQDKKTKEICRGTTRGKQWDEW